MVDDRRLGVGPLGRLRAARRRHRGVGAVVLLFCGLASFWVFQTPPFAATDEGAHLGYAWEVAHGRLPEITDEPAVPAFATEWIAERESAPSAAHRGIWVANHPPLHYLAVAPAIWFADVTERPDGGLLLLRLANVAFAAPGIVFVYLLGTELAGGNRRIGLLAAALVAVTPKIDIMFGQAFNDGLAFSAATAVVWLAVCHVRRSAVGDGTVLTSEAALAGERRLLLGLGTAVAVAAGTRAATMLLAFAVVGALAVVDVLRRRRQPGPVRWAPVLRLAAVGLGPAVVLWGWFYVRNVAVYGDIGASSDLLALFGRRPESGRWSALTSGHAWVDAYHWLWSPSTTRRFWPRPLTVLTVVAAVGFVAAAWVGRLGRHRPISRVQLAVCSVAVLTVAATIAQHHAGGGNIYARYFAPIAGVLAVFAVLGWERLVPVLLSSATVAAATWWSIAQLPTAVDAATFLRVRDGDAGMPEPLRHLPVGDGLRLLTAFTIAGAVAGLAAALLRPQRRTGG